MSQPPNKEKYEAREAYARELDEADQLADYRERFHIPKNDAGDDVIYLAGNSLGLQPKTARSAVEQELASWADLAVDGHFKGKNPWYPYHEMFRDSTARLVGALPGECVMMNSLTVNMHLMLVTFFRPKSERRKIVIDYPHFPSDVYAVKSQLIHHNLDPVDDLVVLNPRQGEHILRMDDIEEVFENSGHEISAVLMSGVNFISGQVFDMERITALARRKGCVVGWDLAHAAGNVPLRLHDWGVDFAVWCSYKYLNSGPGAVGGCFVHERHGNNPDLGRFAGWWGNDPDSRFKMHLQPDFVPRPGADGWQISNPPIMAMAPVKASMDLFDEVQMESLRAKSIRLTGFLDFLIGRHSGDRFEVITPKSSDARGCQISILVHDEPKRRFFELQKHGIVCDFREPNVIRVAPVPFYNSFLDVWRFADVLATRF